MLGIMRSSEDIVASRETFKVAEVLLTLVAAHPRVPVTLKLGGTEGSMEPKLQYIIPADAPVHVGGMIATVAFRS